MQNSLIERYERWGFPQRNNLKIKKCLRINSNQKSDSEIVKRLERKKVKLTKVNFLEHGFFFKSHFPLSTIIENLLGYIYIQEAPAQIPVEVISKDIKFRNLDKNKLKILDMCASPGGKTTQLSEILENKGLVVAIDNKHSRVKKLKFNLERMKVENCDVYTKDAQDIEGIIENYGHFDYVLLDAPCSGNFTSEKNWFNKRKINDFINRQKLQKKLLESAVKSLKKNGILVYSTCSLEKEENEDVIEYGINDLNLRLEPTQINIGSEGITKETKNCLRIWPTQHKMGGFFVAKLKKK